MNNQAPATPAPANPFSVATALSDAFTYILAGFSNLFRLSWRFLAFVVVTAGLFFIAIGILARQENEIGVYIAIGIGALLGLLVSVAYYIVIMRNWLLGEPEPRFISVYGAFLLRAIALTLILAVVMAAIFAPVLGIGIVSLEYFIPENEPSIGIFIAGLIAIVLVAVFAVLAGLYVAGRLTPWMVAAGVAKPLTLRGAWNATSGAGLRIMAGMFGLTLLFMIVDVTIETSLSPLLGINSESFEKIATGEVSLAALFVLLLLKILIYFPQTAASMVYCASVYRQTSGG